MRVSVRPVKRKDMSSREKKRAVAIVQVTSDKQTPLPGPRNWKNTGADFRPRVGVTLMEGYRKHRLLTRLNYDISEQLNAAGVLLTASAQMCLSISLTNLNIGVSLRPHVIHPPNHPHTHTHTHTHTQNKGVVSAELELKIYKVEEILNCAGFNL